MAVSPGTYNFTVQRRSDHDIQLVFKDSTSSAINLTGYTVAAQVWDESRSNKYADFAVAYTNRATGTVNISLTDTRSANAILAGPTSGSASAPTFRSLVAADIPSIAHTKISDFDAGVRTNRLDQMAAPLTSFSVVTLLSNITLPLDC